MKINGGATLWARQTIDSEIFYNKPDVWFKIWFYVVNQVNHKDDKRFKRGTCFLKYEWIMNKTGATKNQVKHCIEFLKKDKMLATQKATRGFIVKVNKYNDYQTLDNYKKPQEKENKRNTEGTQKEHRSHTINKYDKNGKYVKNDKNVNTLSRTFQKCEVVYQLTIYLEGKIRENNPSVNKRTEQQLQSWCKDIDKLLRIDKANPDEVKQIIDWVVEDDFWSSNILSAKKLRKHYPRFYKKVIDRGKSLDEQIKNDHRFDDIEDNEDLLD